MLKDTLTSPTDYSSVSPRLAQGIEFLKTQDLTALACGRHEISDGVFANVMEYTPVPAKDKQYELHFEYIDIQCVISGEERMLIQNVEDGMYHDEGGDCALMDLDGPHDCAAMHPGVFCAVFPGEAHKPGVVTHGATPVPVKKIVVKVHI